LLGDAQVKQTARPGGRLGQGVARLGRGGVVGDDFPDAPLALSGLGGGPAGGELAGVGRAEGQAERRVGGRQRGGGRGRRGDRQGIPPCRAASASPSPPCCCPPARGGRTRYTPNASCAATG